MKSWRMAGTSIVLAMVWVSVAAAQAPDLEPGVQTAAPAPSVAPTPPSQPAASAAAAPPKDSAKTKDHIELDTTQISGNRELPKVMYVVPWRRAGPGGFTGRPPHSLPGEGLPPGGGAVVRGHDR